MPNILHRPILALAACTLTLSAGCVLIANDAELDRESIRADQPLALRTARQQAVADLGCQTISTEILSRKDVEGAPLGPVWSNYLISTTGCGKSATYLIECMGSREGDCYEKRE